MTIVISMTIKSVYTYSIQFTKDIVAEFYVPVAPVLPVGPVIPVFPLRPEKPVNPCGPNGPNNPVFPVGPLAPCKHKFTSYPQLYHESLYKLLY